jgi:hypothetical protein
MKQLLTDFFYLLFPLTNEQKEKEEISFLKITSILVAIAILLAFIVYIAIITDV